MAYSAYRRPDFGFSESLRIARELLDFEDGLLEISGEMAELRDAALAEDAWQGPWGVELRARAKDEDTNVATVMSGCEHEAQQWANAWHDAVTETNAVVYAEACTELNAHLEEQKTIFDHIGDFFVGGDDKALKLVPQPKSVSTPRAEFGFVVLESPFATYTRIGDTMNISYGESQPRLSEHSMSASEYESFLATQVEAGEDPPAPDPLITTKPSLEHSTPEGENDNGRCSIDLHLVYTYLNAVPQKIEALKSRLQDVGIQQGLAISTCAKYRYPSTVAYDMATILIGSLAYNQQAIATVYNKVAEGAAAGEIDPSSFSSELITDWLREADLLDAPELISFEQHELLGVPMTSGFMDDPVNAANGNFVTTDTDLSFQGFGEVLSVERTYNSLTAPESSGVFGHGWSTQLEVALELGDETPLAVRWRDGATIPLRSSPARRDGDGTSAVGTFENLRRRIVVTGDGDGWRLREGREAWASFSPDGVLTGWGSGPATVEVSRSAHTLTLRELESSRSVRLDLVDGLVASATDDGHRRVSYTYHDGHLTQVERPSGGMRYEINPEGRIRSIHDADGVLVCANTYDSDGRVATQRSPHGRRSSFEYLESGATRLTDAQGGPTNVMVHDPRGNLTAMIGGDGRAMRMRWDASDRMTRLTDRDDRITHYRYHPDPDRDLLVAKVLPDGSVQRWEYDEADRLVADIDPAGGITRYTYDNDQRYPATMTDPVGSVTTFERDDRGLLIRSTDPDGVATTYEWNADGLVTAVVNGAGGRTELAYDRHGELVAVTDPGGGSASFEIDGSGRAVRTIDRHGTERRYAYTPAGRPLWCRSAGADSWEATWGSHGEATRVTDRTGAAVTMSYDLFGQQDTVTFPDGQQLRFGYDLLGQIITVEDATGARSERRFDGAGHPISVTDADGHLWRRTVDHDGQTLTLTDPGNAVTRCTYHPGGRLASVEAPDGAIHRFEVDRCGRVTATIDPDGGRTTYTYSPAGRLTERRSPAGRTWTYRYDEAGWLSTVVEPDGSTCTAERRPDGTVVGLATEDRSVHFDIGPDGRMAGWSATATGDTGQIDWAPGRMEVTPAGADPTVFELDGRADVARITDPAGVVTSFDRDLAGRITSTTTGPQTISLGYDGQGRIASITDTIGTVTSIDTSPAGVIRAVDHGDGDEAERVLVDTTPTGKVAAVRNRHGEELVAFDRDPCGRVTAATTPAGTIGVGYDRHGSITSVTDLTGRATTYERDDDGLVTSMTRDDGPTIGYQRSANGDITAFATTDGQRIEAPEPVTSGGSFDTGRLVSDRHGRLYHYDDAGRLVESVAADGTRRCFGYDQLSLLAVESTPELGQRRFTYNNGGQLTAISSSAGTTTYTYDTAGRRVGEEEPDGSRTHYRWNELTQLVAIDRIAPDDTTTTTTITYSGLGRPELVDGTVVGWDDAITGKPVRVGATPYVRSGLSVRPLDSPGTAWDDGTRDDPWGHTGAPGLRLDYRGELALDNLVFLGARIYDTATRQFLTIDPAPLRAGEPASHNRYAYTRCDPVNQIDPSGRSPISLADFDEWRAEQERTRVQSLQHNASQDPWGTVALVGVTLAGAGLLVAATAVTGGGALLLAAGGAGVLLGAGISAGYGYHNKSFDPRASAATGVVSGVAAAIAVLPGLAPVTGWAATASWAGAGAAGGAIGGGGNSLTTQILVEDRSLGEIDWTRVGADAAAGAKVGGITGGIGRHITTILSPSFHAGAGYATAIRTFTAKHADEVFSGTFEWIVEGQATGSYAPDALAASLAIEFAGGHLTPAPNTRSASTWTTGDPIPPPFNGRDLPTAAHLDREYWGENIPFPPLYRRMFDTPVHYMDAPTREAHRLFVDADGKLRSAADGSLFDTRSAPSGGRAIFAMDGSGNLYATTNQKTGFIHHSSLLAGRSVAGAGEIQVVDGWLTVMDNKSGHYQPEVETNNRALEALKEQGLKPAGSFRLVDWEPMG
jgi:RHS repeat-associated protein